MANPVCNPNASAIPVNMIAHTTGINPGAIAALLGSVNKHTEIANSPLPAN